MNEAPNSGAAAAIDAVTLAVMVGTFRAAVNEMNLTMFRSAHSPVITEGRDIGGAVFDARGRLVGQGDWDLAVFVGMLEFTVGAILERYGADFRPGDVFIANDPFVGGTHFNDVAVVRPVFDDDALAGFVAIVGHWPDVGGQEPGSFVANAREHFQEGLRIPPVRLIRAGEPNEAVYELIRCNMRLAEDRIADLRAQVAATAAGAARLTGLAARYGWEVVREAMDATIAHAARLMLEAIHAIPEGRYAGEDWIDMESLDRPEPRAVRVTMSRTGDRLLFDFSASDGETLSASNATLSATSSAVYVTVKSLFPAVPMNHGCLSPIEIVAPPGTLVNAQPPRAISSMAATVYEKVIGACLQAFATAVPELAVGCPYNLINLTIGGTTGDGGEYVAYLYSEGGFGARATKDGPAGLVSLYGGGARITPVEVMEQRYPLRFEEWSLWPDSAGPGRHRGGIGSRKTFRLTGGRARLSCLGDRERFPPFGVLGGGAGAAHGLYLESADAESRSLTLKAVGVELGVGDAVTILAGGGGGYGPALDRDPAAVLADVAEGVVSEAGAERDYGVIVRNTTLDRGATERLRAERRRQEGRR